METDPVKDSGSKRPTGRTPNKDDDKNSNLTKFTCLKIVIRLLPPSLNETQFWEQLDSYSQVHHLKTDSYYVQGKNSEKPYEQPTYSRCYILFSCWQDRDKFMAEIKDKPFTEESTDDQVIPVVTFAPYFNKMPKEGKSFKRNTIVNNPKFKEFVKYLNGELDNFSLFQSSVAPEKIGETKKYKSLTKKRKNKKKQNKNKNKNKDKDKHKDKDSSDKKEHKNAKETNELTKSTIEPGKESIKLNELKVRSNTKLKQVPKNESHASSSNVATSETTKETKKRRRRRKNKKKLDKMDKEDKVENNAAPKSEIATKQVSKQQVSEKKKNKSRKKKTKDGNSKDGNSKDGNSKDGNSKDGKPKDVKPKDGKPNVKIEGKEKKNNQESTNSSSGSKKTYKSKKPPKQHKPTQDKAVPKLLKQSDQQTAA